MNDATLNILLVDDDLGDVRQITRSIQKSGLVARCEQAPGAEEAIQICTRRPFDCVIVDYLLPSDDGLDTISALAQTHPLMALVMATGQGDETVATEAMKRGAADYIRKSDINPVSIRRVIENAVEKSNLRRRLAEQQQELARFADVLVHDLRAPSSAIQTFVWDIQEALRDGNMDHVAQYCQWAVNAAARMDTLIATLYQYTLADGDVPFAPVEMESVLEDTLANLHTISQQSGAAVTHEPLPAVNGNSSQLEQLLQNLIGNAIKYCKEPVARIHIAAHTLDPGTWLFSVADNGIGIAEKDQKRIFDSFTRLHGMGEFEGTGLGLATCRKIVARHGGSIWCESTVGRGTTFFFTLKAASIGAETPAAAEKPVRAA